jgi:hypothetical protein
MVTFGLASRPGAPPELPPIDRALKAPSRSPSAQPTLLAIDLSASTCDVPDVRCFPCAPVHDGGPLCSRSLSVEYEIRPKRCPGQRDRSSRKVD